MLSTLYRIIMIVLYENVMAIDVIIICMTASLEPIAEKGFQNRFKRTIQQYIYQKRKNYVACRNKIPNLQNMVQRRKIP